MRVKMRDGVTADNLVEMIESIRSELVSSGTFSSEEALLAAAIANANINPNLTYDIQATESARVAAAEAVTPIEYQEGQNIVQKGEIISEAQLRLIKQMGLMTENTGASRWLFSAILMGVVFGIALIYCIYQKHSVVRDLKSAGLHDSAFRVGHRGGADLQTNRSALGSGIFAGHYWNGNFEAQNSAALWRLDEHCYLLYYGASAGFLF